MSDTFAAADPEDHIVLAGRMSPGVCAIGDTGRPFKWDKKDAKGSSGATNTYQGEDLAEFDIVFSFWDWATQKAEWDNFAKLLPPSSPKPTALDIYHAELAAINVHSVVVTLIGKPVRASNGLRTVKVSFQQYREPKPSGGTPRGSATGSELNPNGDFIGPPLPPDPVDAQIAALLAKAMSL